VRKDNFEWDRPSEVAALAIAKAKKAPSVPELRWSAFLGASSTPAKKKASQRDRED